MRGPARWTAGVAAAIGFAACLPIPQTFDASPPINGHYLDEAGEPLAGVQLALATNGDSVCAMPALQTVSDSAGAFFFPGTSSRESVTILLPIDRVFGYVLCGRVAGAMRLVFEGGTASYERTRALSLTCIESAGPGGPTVACAQDR